MATENKVIDDALDQLWKIACAKYGDPASRNPPKQLEQVRSFSKGIETLLKTEEKKP